MKQLGFDFLYNNDRYNANNFIVFDSNEEAYYFLNKNKDEENILKHQLIFLSGEKKCGKTHLGMIWKQKHNAKNINFEELFKLDLNDFISKVNNTIEQFDYYLLDNLKENFNEEKLFYLLNTILNNNSSILIISEFNIFKKTIKLKDLKSRIHSGINLKIKHLSKNIKNMFIIKLFSDRLIYVNGDVLKYLVKKLDTNYLNIYNFVTTIDNTLVEDGNKLNLKFIKDLLK